MDAESSVQKFVCSLPNELNSLCKFKVKSEWHEKEGILTILDSHNAWTGKIGGDQISYWSKLLGKSEDEYFQETVKILTTSEESPSFSYTLNDSVFMWKKNVDGGIKIKFGSVTLENIPIQHVANEFIDILSISNKKLNKRIAALRSSITAHQTAQNNLRNKLEKYPALVLDEQRLLFKNFLCLLNSEKNTICSLHTKLDNRFGVKDVLLSHSSILENFDERSRNEQATTNDPYDTDTDVDTEGEADNETEVESNATNSQKTNSQNSVENYSVDSSQDSPVLVLSKSKPRNNAQNVKNNAVTADVSEPGPSLVQPSSSRIVEEPKIVSNDVPMDTTESKDNHQMMYSTQDLFDDL